MTNKQALVNRQQELQNQLDTMPIGKYTTTTAIQNRAISMLGKDKATTIYQSCTISIRIQRIYSISNKKWSIQENKCCRSSRRRISWL